MTEGGEGLRPRESRILGFCLWFQREGGGGPFPQAGWWLDAW